MGRLRVSYALPLVIGLVATGAWFGIFYRSVYRTEIAVRHENYHYGVGIQFCKFELALKTVTIRRYTERTGELPKSLAECEKDALHIEDWMVWAKQNTLYSPLSEPWSPFNRSPNPPTYPRPPVAQDVFGLPVIYLRGEPPVDTSAWVRSSDPLPPGVDWFLATHDGVPAASPQPFALTSLFLRDSVQRLGNWDKKLRSDWHVLIAGLVAIPLLTALLVLLMRRRRAGKVGWLAVAGAALAGGLIANFTEKRPSISCYKPKGFSSSSLYKEERLELLDDAVRRGEISEEVAATARKYIKGLPKGQGY